MSNQVTEGHNRRLEVQVMELNVAIEQRDAKLAQLQDEIQFHLERETQLGKETEWMQQSMAHLTGQIEVLCKEKLENEQRLTAVPVKPSELELHAEEPANHDNNNLP